ncbi:MAG: rhamnulokinase, partial [Planctomycetes bacterium]|nr:rhamnulokinase [Planctomycetota bacterium]
IRLLKNITGLWLVQECRRAWAKQGRQHSWDELNAFAASVSPLASLVDPDDPSLMAPDDMPEAIRALCRRTGQPAPDNSGAVIRCAVESLAIKCRSVLGMLEELIGGRLETIHIVGGGTQNRQLCQATADACGRQVVAGPVEATAIGNVMMQAVAAGAVGSIAQAREVVRRSCTVETYEPKQTAAWDAAYERFQAMRAATVAQDEAQ